MGILVAKNITVLYGKDDAQVKALDDVSINVPYHSIISLSGKSGSGKSTLLNVLSGLVKPTLGEVTFDNINFNSLKKSQITKIRLNKFGFIFQDFQLISNLTVHDNILLPAIAAKNKIDTDFFSDIVNTLNIEHRLNHVPGQLSGGEMQRVAIARALINKPEIIFADEPTGNLDSANSDIVFELLLNCVKNIIKL